MQIEIAKSGTVFMWGGDDGQLAVLIPRLADGKVVWRCVGGSRKATPQTSCDAMNYSPTPEDFAKQ
jgi:hypothetical protein